MSTNKHQITYLSEREGKCEHANAWLHPVCALMQVRPFQSYSSFNTKIEIHIRFHFMIGSNRMQRHLADFRELKIQQRRLNVSALSQIQPHRLYTDRQASADFHGWWAEEMARQSEGRWIVRADVGILHDITTIEIKRRPNTITTLPLILVTN